MKVGWLSLESRDSACSQIRCHTLLSSLAEQHEIEYIPLDRLFERRRDDVLRTLFNLDLVILQRQAVKAFTPDQIRLFGKPGVKVIFEMDDALTLIPDDHELHDFFVEMTPLYLQAMREADWTVVSTPALAELYRSEARRIVVHPNHVDPEAIPVRVRTDEPHPLRILFSGTLSHVLDFQPIQRAVIRFLLEHPADAEFWMWGCEVPGLMQLPNVRRVDAFTVDYKRYLAILSQLPVDFALIPLRDNAFNTGKSALKWMEYALCGIPGIFSPVGEYRDVITSGETGILAENTESEWYRTIVELAESSELRHTLAHNAEWTVRNHYATRLAVERYGCWLREIV